MVTPLRLRMVYADPVEEVEQLRVVPNRVKNAADSGRDLPRYRSIQGHT